MAFQPASVPSRGPSPFPRLKLTTAFLSARPRQVEEISDPVHQTDVERVGVELHDPRDRRAERRRRGERRQDPMSGAPPISGGDAGHVSPVPNVILMEDTSRSQLVLGVLGAVVESRWRMEWEALIPGAPPAG